MSRRSTHHTRTLTHTQIGCENKKLFQFCLRNASLSCVYKRVVYVCQVCDGRTLYLFIFGWMNLTEAHTHVHTEVIDARTRDVIWLINIRDGRCVGAYCARVICGRVLFVLACDIRVNKYKEHAHPDSPTHGAHKKSTKVNIRRPDKCVDKIYEMFRWWTANTCAWCVYRFSNHFYWGHRWIYLFFFSWIRFMAQRPACAALLLQISVLSFFVCVRV